MCLPAGLEAAPPAECTWLLRCLARCWHAGSLSCCCAGKGVWQCLTDGLGVSLVHSLYLLSPGVKDGSWTVLQLVEALGSCLENTDPRTRGRGIQLLSQVLLQCYSLLQEKEVLHLVLFYENRLQDHHLVIPSVLQGLRALSMCEVLSPGLAVSVLKAIFQEVHVQSLLQLDRHTVYSIITNFMGTREEGEGADARTALGCWGDGPWV
uniref:MMS19 nucleotide excision repair protein n=1 Tax=Strix occidentalis caurina TaxID=311401 RepID=A0A8D0EGD8_STROC